MKSEYSLKQYGIFESPEERMDRIRKPDYTTATIGAQEISHRAVSQKSRLLKAFFDLKDATDEEAAKKAIQKSTEKSLKRPFDGQVYLRKFLAY